MYLTDFLYKERGLGMGQATVVLLVYSWVFVLGQYLGAQVGQRLYNRNHALQPIIMGVSQRASQRQHPRAGMLRRLPLWGV